MSGKIRDNVCASKVVSAFVGTCIDVCQMEDISFTYLLEV